MMTKIKDSDVSVLEIWDATSSLAKNTVQSDALNVVDNLIRSNIVSNLNKQYKENNQENNQENNSNFTDEKKSKKVKIKKSQNINQVIFIKQY